jgi:acyl transferase domain-containing protein
MGAQWWGMGAELYRDEPVFRAAFDHARTLLPRVGHGAFGTPMRDPADAQPAGFALQVALTALLRSRGVRPGAVVGHSFGEVAAAWAAGALTLEQAAHVVSVRSRAEQRLAGRGAMLAASLSAAEAERLLPAVTVAAINGPSAVTLAGDPAAIAAAVDELALREVGCRVLPVSVAYHSAQLDALRDELFSGWGRLAPRAPRVALYSTVTAERVARATHDAGYWWRNVREPTGFQPPLERIAADGFTSFVEIGPHPALSPLIVAGGAHAVAPMRRGRPQADTLARALDRLAARVPLTA